MTSPTTDFVSELQWRGLIAQTTGEPELRAHLASATRRGYAGFDPTSDSFTIGNMVPMMLLAHFQRAGHIPVVVGGGGTGLIGDPSGKTAERQLLTREKVEANVASQKRIFEKIIDFSGPRAGIMVNNADWLCAISYLEALRDIGKYFSVNAMIQKESVRERLSNRDQGISYTEFSYMVLQAYDFLHLHQKHGVTMQLGGSDQWGNITAGTDLIRKVHAASGSTGPAPDVHGLTTPLITKADGTKFGKTESGAVWMTADRTSPYAFYQFWLNADDADVERFLKTFTFLPRERIEELMLLQKSNPGAREAQRALARSVTEMLHGKTELDHAEAAAKALFSGEIAGLPEKTLLEALASVPSSDQPRTQLEGDGVPILDLLVTTGLAASKREAKEFLAGGSVALNGRKVGPEDRARTADLLHGSIIALRRGKKNWHVTRWK
ncbi:MAG TPA: tyrosine--tRNA ligase [Phycisphaerales bacterium]|nr:tyrosine--tRNA ligase [Phycisphaerales bacterium]